MAIGFEGPGGPSIQPGGVPENGAGPQGLDQTNMLLLAALAMALRTQLGAMPQAVPTNETDMFGLSPQALFMMQQQSLTAGAEFQSYGLLGSVGNEMGAAMAQQMALAGMGGNPLAGLDPAQLQGLLASGGLVGNPAGDMSSSSVDREIARIHAAVTSENPLFSGNRGEDHIFSFGALNDTPEEDEG